MQRFRERLGKITEGAKKFLPGQEARRVSGRIRRNIDTLVEAGQVDRHELESRADQGNYDLLYETIYRKFRNPDTRQEALTMLRELPTDQLAVIGEKISREIEGN